MFDYFKRLKAGFHSITIQYVNPYNRKLFGRIGKFTIVKNNSLLVPENMFLDDYVVIQELTNFLSNKGKLIVGKYSVISSKCTIIPGSHTLTVGVPFYLSTTNHLNDKEGDVIIEQDCWIGTGCILLPGCKIGRGAVVGAGSIVKKEIPPYAVVVGAPARIVASKFTIDEIIKHEEILYPKEERMQKEALEKLFEEKFKGLKSIGCNNLSSENYVKLKEIRKELGLKDYSED